MDFKKNFELFTQYKVILHDKITEVQLGEAKSSNSINWLHKAEKIRSQLHDLLERNSDLLMNLHTVARMLKRLGNLLKRSPSGNDSVVPVACGKSKTMPSAEAYEQVQENKKLKLKRKAKEKVGMSPTHGKEAVKGEEMQQGICLQTPARPSTDASTRISNAETRADSQSERGQTGRTLTKDFEKSEEPTINQAEEEIPLENGAGQALPEPGVNTGRMLEVETGNVAFQNERGQALLEAGVGAGISIKQLILSTMLDCMKDATTSRIAIHGIGGIGKTTVLKKLVTDVNEMFDVIIWVTVTRDWSTRKIQNEVLRQLSLSLPDSETDSEVAKTLIQSLNSRTFLFILDDVWERVDLKAVGIPGLSPAKGCSVIVASRRLDVCKEMAGKRVFKMEPVSREEAWALFREKVGELVESPGIQPYAEKIVVECGGLPLLIIVTGGAMRGVNDVLEWKHALTKLELPTELVTNGNEAVMHRLKFSFDRLKSFDIQSCFLYCALFSEEHEVEVSHLVQYCIEEGIIAGNRPDACKRGNDMVDFLVGASLLQRQQSTMDRYTIKMHDVIRELALNIILSGEDRPYSKVVDPSNPGTSSLCRRLESPESNTLSIHEGHHFLLRAGVGLTKPPPPENWEQAKMIALMDNHLSRLPENPSCPNLRKLFLQRNRRLRVIPASFFECMPSLEVLNLSNTRIKLLPQLITKLKRLKVLILRNCERLVALPSEVGSLGDLEVLDLQGTEVNSLPDEIGNLACLRHLEVSFYGSISPDEYAHLPDELLSDGILSKLLSLETLSIDVHPGDPRWKKKGKSIVTDVCKLIKLTALSFYFPEVEVLRHYLRTCPTWNNDLLAQFKFVVGYDVKRIVSRVPTSVMGDYDQQGQCLRFVNGENVDDVVVKVLARTVSFYLDHHLSIHRLSQFGVRNINGLKLCIVSECPKIQSIIDGEDLEEPSQTVFPSLEHLSIHYLWNLKWIWKGIIPHTSFSKLRFLLVHSCPELKFVFTRSMLSCVSNLEELVVEDCSAIHEVIALQGQIRNSETDLLPRLKTLKLHHLPELVNNWEGGWPSLKSLSLIKCPNWKMISLNSKVEVYKQD